MPWSISNWLHRVSTSDSSSIATGKYLLDAAVLEKRLLFSATPIAPPVVDHVDVDSGQTEPLVVDVATSTSGGSESNDGQRTSRLQLVFVDAGVEDHQQLIDDLWASNDAADLEIYLLDEFRDGVEQITEILNGYQDVDAIHLLSHGNDGKLRLGNSALDGGNLAGYAGDFAHWQSSLTDEADLLLYGCELAETDSGVAMLEALAALTGADVAASTDDTGHASLGGDWDLEYVGGIIESESILDLQSNSRWKGVLSAPDIAATGEIRVNGTTSGVQTTNSGSTSVAVDDAGNSIVVWTEQSGLDGDGYGIFARRFNDQGIPLGAEFKVNETVAGAQSAPVVAMDSSGRFVIAWISDDGSGSGIYLRRFNADGTAIDTNDLLANAGKTSGDQKDFDLATNASGQIVIVFDNEGPGNALWARTFDFTATAPGDELPTTLKSIAISGLPTLPSVDINDGGRIVFAWQESASIYSASYDFAGLTAVGPTHELNGGTSNEREIVVAVRSDNDYVVAFRSDVGGSEGVWTRLIPEAGPSGMQPATLVSGGATATGPSIDIDDSDNFVITYQKADAAGTGTYRQVYTSDMVKSGGETLVNQTTDGEQSASSIAIHDYKNAVVVWSGNGTQSGHVDGDGVFLRQFSNTAPVADLTAGAPYTISEGDALSLDGSNSSDVDGDTLSYAWDLDNDGIFGEINEPVTATAVVSWATLASFGINDDGTHTIGLRVDDGQGGIATQTTTVTVQNTAPVLSATGGTSAVAGTTYTLNLSATDPGDDTLSQWRVDWGDGTINLYAGSSTSVSHTYTIAGLTHNILVSATDEDGKWYTGDLFVASSNFSPVERFDALTGAFEIGTGNFNDLKRAEDFLIGPDGMLYASAFLTSNVQRFDPATGVLDGDFVIGGSGGLDKASGIAFGPDGNLYVGSHGTDQVLRYDGTTGAFIDVFVSANAGGLDGPRKILFGADGNLYVASELTDSILRFNGSTGAYIDDFVTSGAGGLDGPKSFGFGRDGNLYVTSSVTDQILRYNGSSGALIDIFVASGVGGLANPFGLAFGPDDSLYVTTHDSGKLLRYDFNGNFVDEFGNGFFKAEGLTFTPTHQVSVVTSNTTPLATNTSQTIGYTEDDSAVAIADIVVTDPDVGETITATLTLNLPATGTLSTGTFGVSTSTYVTGSGIWQVSGTVTDVNAALAAVAFTPATDNDVNSQITVHIEDSVAVGPADGLIQLNVTAQNDAPDIDLDANNSSGATGADFNVTFIEGGGAVLIADSADADLSDVDSGSLSSLTITITNLLGGIAESLSADTSGTSISAAYLAGTLTLSGVDSVANYEQVLRTVRYNNVSLDPNTTTRVIQFVANDGAANSTIATASVSITTTNNAPTLDLDADDSSGTGGTGFQASFVEGGGAVRIGDFSDANLNDVDSASLTSLTATLTNPLDGSGESLSADTSGTSITATYAGGTLTLSGTDSVANYQQVLRSIRYLNTSVAPSTTARVIDIVADDGISASNLATATINVTSINSAPTITTPGTQTPSEDTPWSINGISVSDSDIGTGMMQFSMKVARGTLTLDATVAGGLTASDIVGNGRASVTVTATLAQLNTTLAATNGLTYLGNPNINGIDTLTLKASDFIDSTTETVNINVLAVNDAPVAVKDQFTMNPDSKLTVGAGGLLANDFDVDGNAIRVVPVSGPSSGTLTLGADGSFQFTPVASFSGFVSFAYAVTDGTATSAPARVVINVLLPIRPADLASASAEPEPENVPEEPPAEEEGDEETEPENETYTPVTASVPEADTSSVDLARGVVQTNAEEILTISVVPQRLAEQTESEQRNDESRSSSPTQNDNAGRVRRSDSIRSTGSVLGIGRFDSKLLWSDMEDMQGEINEGFITPYIFAGSFAGVSSALSVGYVMWTIRGGLLATSLLAHLPAWSFVDPLLVLDELDDDDDGDDDSLAEMLDKSESERGKAESAEAELEASAL